jgi:hypothetical protein
MDSSVPGKSIAVRLFVNHKSARKQACNMENFQVKGINYEFVPSLLGKTPDADLQHIQNL